MLAMMHHLVAYDNWANRRVINSLKASPKQNSQAVRLLAHLLTAEKAWLTHLKGEDTSRLDLWPGLSLEQCELLADETHKAYAAFFKDIFQNHFDWARTPENPRGSQCPIPIGDVFVQIISQAAYDRGQVAAAIHANGETPAETDYLTFTREAERSGSLLVSVVIPVYNEAAALPTLLEALRQVLAKMDCAYELIFVNDGSTDNSFPILSEAALFDPRVKVLVFSRNFGHQAAITAGLDFASGDAVVIMDADLQDPPEILPDMVELFRQGYDVVSAQRVSREGDGLFKRATAAFFYWLMRRTVDARLVAEVGDFRLFSRAAIVALRSFREQHRFMRGLVAWLGLKEAIVPFHRRARIAGSSKYSLWRMLRFAWTAISSFSALPLRLSLPFGMLLTAAGFLYLAYVLYATLVLRATVPGWTSLVALQVIFSGSMLVAIGLLGDYIARIYEESKARPLYVLSHTVNFAYLGREVERAVVLPAREIPGSSEHSEEARQSDPARKHAVRV